MKKLMSILAFSSLTISAPVTVQASMAHPLHEQISFYKYSVTQSSVSPTLSEQSKSEKLALLNDARQQVELGNYGNAKGLLKTVAQSLYSMSPGQNHSEAHLSSRKASAIVEAMESILPQAQRIASEKQTGQEQLDQVMLDHQRAKAALKSNDFATASNLLKSSYRLLKQNVADLRSGDRLMINLPAPDSREGWMDAAHRYIDWRYFNRQLLSELQLRGMNTANIDQANVDADQMYDLASNIALQGDWEQAVATVDQAYRILEKAWLKAGVDVGV